MVNNSKHLSHHERTVLLLAVFIISICALTYELIIATLSSYLLGNSVTQFSFTIGFFLFAMGIGSLLSRRIQKHELRWFIIVELLIALFGGSSAIVLYAVFSAADLYYYATMIGISLIVGICIGLEIPLLTRIVARQEDLSNALANVLSIDYLGALIGSLVFPIILLPLIGVTQTAFLMGLFNILVAAVLLNMFKERLKRRWVTRLWVACGVVVMVMIAGVISSDSIVSFFEQQLYRDFIVYSEQSPYQRIVITRKGQDIRLFLDGNLQFSSRDEYRYHEMLVHPVMSVARSHETVLVLGGGDGMVARELLKYDGMQRIVVVDLDPSVVNLAIDHPMLRELTNDSMRDSRVEVINQDAYKYIEETDLLFPVVIIDLPDPNNESLSKLYSQQFYRLLKNRLTPDGVFITQSTSPYFVREAFWTIANTIEASELFIIPLRTHVPSFGEWGFVIGSPYQLPELTIPDDIELRYLTSDVLRTSHIFDPDTAYVETQINTLDNPILSRVYEQGWRQWH